MIVDPAGLELHSWQGRGVLAATVLGTALTFIDGTAVGIALPAIGADLGADLQALAWTVNAYTLTLAAFVLLGGSLGDHLGRRRIFLVGVVWFAAASGLCGLAPNTGTLLGARALQGIGAALLTPGSLALLQSAFCARDRARAIGAWSGMSGLAAAGGPFVGGYLVDTASWRWIFLINLPVAVAVVVLCVRHVPESRNVEATGYDLWGAGLAAAGLAAATHGLLSWPGRAISSPPVWTALTASASLLAVFVVWERRSSRPMLPPSMFRSRTFTAANVVTLAVYAGLGGVFFWLVLGLQVISGFSAVAAGAAQLPLPLLMLLLSSWAGGLGQRIGPRLPMTVGCVLAAAGTLALSRLGRDASYVADVLPGAGLLGLGLALLVTPLTATVLDSAPLAQAGVASGVNNAAARVGGLLAVAALPAVTGLAADDYGDPSQLQEAYRAALQCCAGLFTVGAALSGTLRPLRAPSRTPAAQPHVRHCSLDAPPLQPPPSDDQTRVRTTGTALGPHTRRTRRS